MELIVDLHIHSRFARATSKSLNIESIYKWAKIKGINIIATGDFTHPAWFKELKDSLEPAEDGLYKLKQTLSDPIDAALPNSVKDNLVRFILSVEISTIYSKKGKVRRLHSLCILPSFEAASKLINQIGRFGKLGSDGRPILGLDTKELLKMTLESDNEGLFVPAHIWTPWFAMFGSNSGFDSIEEAFDEEAKNIYAVETGLSSDPFMNWRLSSLEKRTIVSGSDAHSLPKLAREANILDCKVSYRDIREAIITNDKRFIGTFEFFPEEGMYHLDGHRKCNVKMTPEETEKVKGICPVCKTKLVVGVLNRVDSLADHSANYKPENHKVVESIVPLIEIIAEIKNIKNTGSPAVMDEYEKVYTNLGSDFHLFRHVAPAEINNAGFPLIAQAIEKMRNHDLFIEPGYDGVYGTVKIFKPGELETQKGQMALF